MKIKIPKIKKKFKKGGIHSDPDIYWGGALLVAFIIVVIAVVMSFNLFRKINADFTPGNDNGGLQAGKIREERIESVLEYFSIRGQRTEKIISSPSPVVDPSL